MYCASGDVENVGEARVCLFFASPCLAPPLIQHKKKRVVAGGFLFLLPAPATTKGRIVFMVSKKKLIAFALICALAVAMFFLPALQERVGCNPLIIVVIAFLFLSIPAEQAL